ncbi:hypothetical protein K469DRAFT_625040 [Zopfia rhizophila CBS 207.26]|uniref:Nitrogen permease regulator 3 n=1 Tax=Zopfia rhizophila CBS 207.26 TaxID=1314779 RepID=A0A6A6EEF5_9PEZI|nr:hypothetical protein K469DRAFT_625040 [Zopfia rhizophila CBS 207.26]
MSLPLPPASNLHAILLVTKSRSLGPRLVFHYPPLSLSAASLAANKVSAWYGNETSTGSLDSQSSSSDWDSSTENEGTDDDLEARSRTSGGRGSGRTSASHRDRDRYRPGAGGARGRQDSINEDGPDLDENENGDYRKSTEYEKEKGGDYDWNTVLGFKVDALEKILCPSRSFNKRRFELGVESIVFVGAPMFVRDNGLWKKGRRKKDKTTPAENQQETDPLTNLKIEDQDGVDSHEHGNGGTSTEPFVYPEGFEPGYGHGLMSGAASGAGSEAGSDTRSNSTTDNGPDMTMFNIVFVLNPPALEYQLRVKEMYDNVTRKYAKALKYEQARSHYVWKESRKIINIKQRAKDNGDSLSVTWREIIHNSPLAKSMAIMFDAISNDKIAHVHFNSTLNGSFQIPQPMSTPYLPTPLEPQMPGLWLTTSNVVNDEDNDAPLTQHSALLLLEDTETLVKELEGDAKENAATLAFYIRNIVPTKSLQKISIKHNIPAQDIEYIASHLVYWRRARLIPPLHPRDIYIVSPNADMGDLQAAIPAYAARFPTLPSLPKILSMLSGTPRPYRTFIPTNEHREAYMEILAWLMRGGWVTQLRTFAWVRVTPEIKAEVALEIEREAALKKAEEARKAETSDNESLTESMFSDNKRSSFLSTLSVNRPSTPLRRHRPDANDEEMSASTILSPWLPAYRGFPNRPASDAGSTSSNRTTIPLNQAPGKPASPQSQVKPHRPSLLHLKQTTSPSLTSTTNTTLHSHSTHPLSPLFPLSPTTSLSHTFSPPHSPALLPSSDFTSSIILSPQKANSLEARWLEKIGQSFQDKDLREQWSMILRYFDGKHALDDIAVREGLKRKRVWGLINGIRVGGWLVAVRHW